MPMEDITVEQISMLQPVVNPYSSKWVCPEGSWEPGRSHVGLEKNFTMKDCSSRR